MKLRIIFAAAAIALSGSVLAQANPAKPPRVALKGHDPVSYFTEGRPVRGESSIRYDFDDSRYLFSSAKNRERFVSDPDRYTPQFAGLCTTGLSMGQRAEANPSVFLVRDGKLYVFYSTEAREMFEKDPSLLAKARQAWDRK